MAFAASTQFEWLAFASLEPGSCSCSHGDVQVDVCANGVCKGRVGGGPANVTCDCTVPMWGVLESPETNDAQLLYGGLSYEGTADDDMDAAFYRIYAMDFGQGGDAKVVSMADNKVIFQNSEPIATLNKGERWTGPVNDFDEFSATGPIYGSVRAAGGEHDIVMASGRLKGRTFSFGNDRRTAIGLWTRALEADATCTVTTNEGAVATTTIPAGTGYIFDFDTSADSDQGVVLACDADVVLATRHTTENDYIIVPPESTEWYGVISTYLSVSHSGADELSVQESCSDGSTRTITIPGGGNGARSEAGYDEQYSGKACAYSAASPFNIQSRADGDGGDAVNLLPTSTGAIWVTAIVIPSYVVASCVVMGFVGALMHDIMTARYGRIEGDYGCLLFSCGFLVAYVLMSLALMIEGAWCGWSKILLGVTFGTFALVMCMMCAAGCSDARQERRHDRRDRDEFWFVVLAPVLVAGFFGAAFVTLTLWLSGALGSSPGCQGEF